jgi:hypothetical protein
MNIIPLTDDDGKKIRILLLYTFAVYPREDLNA